MLESMREGIQRVSEQIPDMPVREVILSRMLMVSGDMVATRLTQALRPHGLGESEFRTLMVLFSSEQGEAHPSDLCMFATQKPNNMTRITDGLVARGLASRSHSKEDRRRIVLRITAEGRRFVRKFLPDLFPRVDNMFDVLSETDRKQLERILSKLLHHLGQQAQCEKDAP